MSTRQSVSQRNQTSRSDSQRNREAILRAAHDLFVLQGLEIDMNTIARSAGVAVGTIYRHYSSKEDLINAIVVHQLHIIADLAESCVADDRPDPFKHFFEAVAAMCVVDGPFAAVVSQRAQMTAETRTAETQVQRALAHVLRHAQQQGEIREDLEVNDIPALMASIRRAAQTQDHTQVQRIVEIILAGVKA